MPPIVPAAERRGYRRERRAPPRSAGSVSYGAAKLDALRSVLGEADTREAAAYADSASDLPVMEACGHPVAVKSDRVLRRTAVERG